jgi:hypothetical protein
MVIMDDNIIGGKKVIQTVLGISTGIRPRMNFLLDYCAKVQDSPVWKKISNLNFEKDNSQIQSWLINTITSQPPGDNIQALWFGVYFPILNSGETSCDLYLSGSTRFNAEDMSGEWARLSDDSYLPEGCYVKSKILAELYNLIHRYEVEKLGESILCLGYACFSTQAALSSIDRRFLLGSYGPRPVAVGLDNGDFVFLDL